MYVSASAGEGSGSSFAAPPAGIRPTAYGTGNNGEPPDVIHGLLQFSESALQSVQNGKRLKVGKLYMEWYNFGVEPPPQMMPPGFRPGRRATYR